MEPVYRSTSRDVRIELAADPGRSARLLVRGAGDARGLGVADADMRLDRIRGAAGRETLSADVSEGEIGMLRRTLPVGVGGDAACAIVSLVPLTEMDDEVV